MEDEEFSDEEFLDHELEDHEIFSDDNYVESGDEWQPEVSIPPIPRRDASGPDIPHFTRYKVEGLDDEVWAAFPDALVDRMLTRLPPAAFARLRSVCKRWNELPLSPEWLRQYAEVARRPSCTIMCQLGLDTRLGFSYFESPPLRVPARNDFFFCHSEQKWFKMPPLGIFQEEGARSWELADVDWGLVCYACYEDFGLSLCVTNPLTKAETVVSLPFFGCLGEGNVPNYKFGKLVVDRQSKTYKIVVLLRSSKPPSTLVYDSATARWTILQSYPPLDPHNKHAAGCFLWKRTIYMPGVHPGVLLAFNVDTGQRWRRVKIDSTGGSEMKYVFASVLDRLMIIRSYSTENSTSPISVLALKDDAANPFPLSRGNVWVEMDVHNRAYLQKVVSVARHAISHSDCLIFPNPTKNQWVTYTFSTRTWREMPSPSERDTEFTGRYGCLEFEPRWDIGTGPGPSRILSAGAREG